MTNTQKLDLILLKLEDHDRQFERINDKFDNIDKKFESIDKKFESIDKKFERIDKKFESIDKRLDNIESDVKNIKLTLENEIRVNIRRIAEGHLDLSRRLQQAIKPNQEVEMLTIRVNVLENDVCNLKQRIS